MGDHDLGLRLRQALLQERGLAQALDGRRLQALVGDLCQGEQQALLPPLRHLVLSPVLLGEASRTPPLMEPRSRARFQQELRGVFASPLCDRMDAVIDGLLDLPAAPRGTDQASQAPFEPLASRSAPIAAAEPRPVPLAAETPAAGALTPVSPRQDPDTCVGSSGGRNLWPLMLAGVLAGCLLALVGLLLPVSLRRSLAPETALIPAAPPESAGAAASGPAADAPAGPATGADQSADALATTPSNMAPTPSPTTSTLPPGDPAMARPDGGAATPAAPELPQAQQAAGPAAVAEPSTAAAIRTVEALYGALGRHDAAAARGYFAGEAADQFDPAFFRQFARVEVAALQPSAISPTSVSLDGVVTFVYPDGSRQTERRSFTVDTSADPPRVIASAFGAVLRPRGPVSPEPGSPPVAASGR
jgi:hypothetical protein